MFVYVCAFVCCVLCVSNTHIHVHTHVCISEDRGMAGSVRVCVLYIRMYACTFTCPTITLAHVGLLHICMYTCRFACPRPAGGVRVRVLHIRMYVCMYVCMFIYKCTSSSLQRQNKCLHESSSMYVYVCKHAWSYVAQNVIQ